LESLTKKRKEYQPPRFMSVSEAAEQLLVIIRRKHGDHEELGMLQPTCVGTTIYLSHYQLHFSFFQPAIFLLISYKEYSPVLGCPKYVHLLSRWVGLPFLCGTLLEYHISVLSHELCTCINSMCMLMSDLLFLHFYSV